MIDSLQFFSNPYFLAFIGVVAAYIISIHIYAIIIYMSHQNDIMDEPCGRIMHKDKTPTLGGVGLFITFALHVYFKD